MALVRMHGLARAGTWESGDLSADCIFHGNILVTCMIPVSVIADHLTIFNVFILTTSLWGRAVLLYFWQLVNLWVFQLGTESGCSQVFL